MHKLIRSIFFYFSGICIVNGVLFLHYYVDECTLPVYSIAVFIRPDNGYNRKKPIPTTTGCSFVHTLQELCFRVFFSVSAAAAAGAACSSYSPPFLCFCKTGVITLRYACFIFEEHFCAIFDKKQTTAYTCVRFSICFLRYTDSLS